MASDSHTVEINDISSESVKLFVCDICNLCYAQEKSFKLHQRAHKEYPCEYCKEVFFLKSQLDAHHSLGVCQKYVCPFCNKDFKTVTKVKLHSRIHTGERPFVCEVCGKDFTQRGTLENHYLTHTSKNQYCTNCHKSFRNKRILKAHSFICNWDKKILVCDICNKRFKHKERLEQHLSNHSENKPHLCDICQKAFSTKGNLKRHFLSHMRKKPEKEEFDKNKKQKSGI